jgi:hypothetical protein
MTITRGVVEGRPDQRRAPPDDRCSVTRTTTMTDTEIIDFVAAMPDVAVLTASAENGAPEVAWGDTFFFYEPPGAGPDARRMPFATIVRNDYGGDDAVSELGRPEVFRLNVGVGRERFEGLVGFAPAAYAAHRGEFDHAALDVLTPHPVYAAQGWVAVLNPGERTAGPARSLLAEAHARARAAHERKHGAPAD